MVAKLVVTLQGILIEMKTNELLRAAVQLYFGTAINFVGLQLLILRVADKVRQATEKVWPPQKSAN